MKKWPLVVMLLALAAASEPAQVTVGATVYDPLDGLVGTILSVKDDVAVLSTGSSKITLGLKSFWTREGKLRIKLPREALEAKFIEVQNKGDAEVGGHLKAGATIYDSQGEVAASVDSVTGDRVRIIVSGVKADFPIAAFSVGPKGAMISGTTAQLREKLNVSPPSPPQSAPESATPESKPQP